GAGHGARRADDERGGTAPRHTGGNGEDTDDAGQAPAAGGTDMSASWHADAALIDQYSSGTIDDAQAFSLEAHLLACAECRAAVAVATPPDRLDAVWAEVVEAIDVPRPHPLERLLRRLGVSGESA